MENVKVKCPTCGRTYIIPESGLGRKGKCTKCLSVFVAEVEYWPTEPLKSSRGAPSEPLTDVIESPSELLAAVREAPGPGGVQLSEPATLPIPGLHDTPEEPDAAPTSGTPATLVTLPPAPEASPRLPKLLATLSSALAVPPPAPAETPRAEVAWVDCPHCHATNPNDANFCERCGQSLAGAKAIAPEIAMDPLRNITTAELMEKELRTAAHKAARVLFLVGLFTILGGLLSCWLLSDIAPRIGMEILISNLVLAATYIGLGFWARENPLPACIVGLALLLTFWTIDLVVNHYIPLVVWVWLWRFFILATLVGAIMAGLKYKNLKARMPAKFSRGGR